jgi:WD40 repeat protein
MIDSLRLLGFDWHGDLLALDRNNALITYNPETLRKRSGREFPGLVGREDGCMLTLLSDGRTLSVASRPEHQELKLELWDANDCRLITSVEAVDSHPVYASNKRLFAAATRDRTVSVWELPGGLRKFVLTNSTSPVAFSADGALLATALADGAGFKLWRLEQDKLDEPSSIRVAVKGVDGVAFSPDGRMLAIGEWDGSVGVWRVPSGQKIATLIGHKRAGCVLCFSPDGRTLASVSDDRIVRLWLVGRQRELMRFELPGHPNPYAALESLEFSRDGRTLLYCEPSCTRVWRAPSLAELGFGPR